MKYMIDTGPFVRRAWGAVLALAVVAVLAPAQAQLRVDITRGTVQPLRIAIPEFFGKTPQEVETGRNMANLISADLERSGLFKPIDRRAFIQKVSALRVQPRFGDWRQINAQALVNLGYRRGDAFGAVTGAMRTMGGDVPVEELIRAGLKELTA